MNSPADKLLQPQETVRETLTAASLLRLYPLLQGSPQRPWMLLHDRVLADLHHLLGAAYSRQSISHAFSNYTSSVDYLWAVHEGAALHDLEGNIVGRVSKEQERRAEAKLVRVVAATKVTAVIAEAPAKQSPSAAAFQLMLQRFPTRFDIENPKPILPRTYQKLLRLLGDECTPTAISTALARYFDHTRAARQTPTTIDDASATCPGQHTSISSSELKHCKLRELVRRYPMSIGADPLKPLAPNVFHELVKELADQFTTHSIRAALFQHYEQPDYQRVVVTGAKCVNLAGEEVREVTEKEARAAQIYLQDPLLLAPWRWRLRQRRKLDPGTRHLLLKAFESTGLSTGGFAERYGIKKDLVVAQVRLAMKERELKHKLLQQLADSFTASGLTPWDFAQEKKVGYKTVKMAIAHANAAGSTTTLSPMQTSAAPKEVALQPESSIPAQAEAEGENIPSEEDFAPERLLKQNQAQPTVVVKRKRRIGNEHP